MRKSVAFLLVAAAGIGAVTERSEAALVRVTFSGTIARVDSPENLPSVLQERGNTDIGSPFVHTMLYDTSLGLDNDSDPTRGIYYNDGFVESSLSFGAASATSYDPFVMFSMSLITDDGNGRAFISLGGSTNAPGYFGSGPLNPQDSATSWANLDAGALASDQIPLVDTVYTVFGFNQFQYDFLDFDNGLFASVYGQLTEIRFTVVPAPATAGVLALVGLGGLRRRRSR